MRVMADWFDVIRWIGAAYLVWLGIGRLRGRLARQERCGRAAAAQPWPLVLARRGGLAVQSQGAAVSRRFLPAIHRSGRTAGPQLALLAVTFVASIALVDCMVASAAGSARAGSPRSAAAWRKASAALCCSAAGFGLPPRADHSISANIIES